MSNSLGNLALINYCLPLNVHLNGIKMYLRISLEVVTHG